MKSKDNLFLAITMFALGVYSVYKQNGFGVMNFLISAVNLAFFISDNKERF